MQVFSALLKYLSEIRLNQELIEKTQVGVFHNLYENAYRLGVELTLIRSSFAE